MKWLLLWLIGMQFLFDIMVVGDIIHGEAAYRIITYKGALVTDAMPTITKQGIVPCYLLNDAPPESWCFSENGWVRQK